MRHRKSVVKFGRKTNHYKTTLRHLVAALIINKSIHTTKTKAKQASRLADKLVTIGKDNTVNSKRKVYSVLRDRNLVSILFNEIEPLFKNRNGGYTRTILSGRRRGDNAQMAILEFVEKPAPKEKKPNAKIEKEQKPEKKGIQEGEIVKKKEDIKKDVHTPKRHENIEKARPTPGFFRRFFRRKREM